MPSINDGRELWWALEKSVDLFGSLHPSLIPTRVHGPHLHDLPVCFNFTSSETNFTYWGLKGHDNLLGFFWILPSDIALTVSLSLSCPSQSRGVMTFEAAPNPSLPHGEDMCLPQTLPLKQIAPLKMESMATIRIWIIWMVLGNHYTSL